MINELLEYYDKNKRDLPWRRVKDPYAIWISEIMCQQTRVDTVIPYFERFMSKYPSVFSLANANEEELLKIWQGLGYYNRAKNLKKAAMLIVSEYNGVFPEDYEELLKLPGIGDYTACAILSMAFDLPFVSIDGNFFRVFSRFYEDKSDITKKETKNRLAEKLIAVMPKRSGDFNQAVMDLGATICVPFEEPRCGMCPIKYECNSYKNKSYLQYPYSSKKQVIKTLDYSVFIIQVDGKFLIRKRPNTGLLAGLYEFLNVPLNLSKAQVIKKFNTNDVEIGKTKTHHFTHQTWIMQSFILHLPNYEKKEDEILVTLEEINQNYSMPRAFNQFLEEL